MTHMVHPTVAKGDTHDTRSCGRGGGSGLGFLLLFSFWQVTHLRMTNVTSPLHESRLLWMHDPHPTQPPRVTSRPAVPKKNNDTVPRNNNHTVPRNTNTVNKSDAHARAPLGTIPSASWYNSSLPLPSAPSPAKVAVNQCPGMMYSNKEKQCIARLVVLLSPLRKRGIVNIEGRGVREREKIIESFIHDARWANQRSLVPGSSSVPVRVTQSVPQAVDPISSMRTAVYPPLESVGNPTANENSPFPIGLESNRNLGLYKPTAPDPNQDTWAYNFAANSSEVGPPSPTRTFAANSSGSGNRTGIIYPLQPRGRRPDVCIEVEASLPEPAALLRPDLHHPESPTQPQEAPANLPRTYRRLSRKRRRNRSTAVFRPAKRSPPRGYWCD